MFDLIILLKSLRCNHRTSLLYEDDFNCNSVYYCMRNMRRCLYITEHIAPFCWDNNLYSDFSFCEYVCYM